MVTTTTTSAEKNLAVGHWMWPLNSLERVQTNLIQHSPFLFRKVSVELTLVFQGTQGNCQCQKLCNFQDDIPRSPQGGKTSSSQYSLSTLIFFFLWQDVPCSSYFGTIFSSYETCFGI